MTSSSPDLARRGTVRNSRKRTRDIGRAPIEPSGPKHAGYRAKHCLAIGIDQYTEFPRLKHAVHDAQGVGTLLSRSYGFEVRTILDYEATRAGIGDAVTRGLASTAQPDDLVVIFFAGHGETLDLPNGDKRGFIVPVEAKPKHPADLIAVDDVVGWLDFLPCRHALLIFDSCFSGMLTVRAPAPPPGTDFFVRRARLSITAGGADETVVDGGWNNNSVFTGLLLKALTDNTAARADGVTTATSLFSLLAQEVPKAARQTPAFGTLPGSEGGDVVLASHGAGISLAPISTSPPPFIGSYSPDFPQSGHTTRARAEIQETAFQAGSGAKVPIFAEAGRQWAVLIGTNPVEVVPGLAATGGVIPTEFLDAYDVLDWFLNPDIHGALPEDQLFFLADAEATESKVRCAMEEVASRADAEDSVLFYFSGHSTTFGSPGELLLYDSPVGDVAAGLNARDLIRWLNDLRAEKAVAILDSGGYGAYLACSELAPGRFVLSSINGMTLSRNGFVTWYVRRALQKLGPGTTLEVLHSVLEQAEGAWIERNAGPRLYVYSRGRMK